MALTTFYITNNLDIALIAEKCGVNRIWIDLETLGKEERQKGMNTVKSHHTIDDIKCIAPKLTTAQMMVRVNPWNEGSTQEIDKVVEAGAETIMLPMWKTPQEVQNFISAVNGRTRTSILLETKEAVECLDEVLKIKGIDEIHIGLNDLHLSYHLTFMFELLTNGAVESIINKIKTTDIPYGFGGVSHIGDGLLPAEMIILEHYRMGSKNVILSRSFCDTNLPLEELYVDFNNKMTAMREFEKSITKEMIEQNREVIKERVDKVVAIIKERKKCN